MGPAQQQQVESAAIEIESYLETELAGRDHEWFALDPQYYLKTIIVTILNAFPSSLSWILEHVEEVPAQDLLFGIRPVLIAMLRRDVMLKREVRLCIRQGCGRYFMVTRSDQGCCSRKCREMVNNRLQYQRHTKLRRQREAKRKRRRKD